jgi:excisionase family DNA binding protein
MAATDTTPGVRWGDSGPSAAPAAKRMSDSELLEEPLMDAVEAARVLRVPRSTLYELVRSQGLPHVRVGPRGLRFARRELARWVAQNSFGR